MAPPKVMKTTCDSQGNCKWLWKSEIAYIFLEIEKIPINSKDSHNTEYVLENNIFQLFIL